MRKRWMNIEARIALLLTEIVDIMLKMSNVGIQLIKYRVKIGFHKAHPIEQLTNPWRFIFNGLWILGSAFLSCPFPLRSNLRSLLFFLCFKFINLLKKSINVFTFTKIMFPNQSFIDRGELFRMFEKGIIKKNRLGWV